MTRWKRTPLNVAVYGIEIVCYTALACTIIATGVPYFPVLVAWGVAVGMSRCLMDGRSMRDNTRSRAEGTGGKE